MFFGGGGGELAVGYGLVFLFVLSVSLLEYLIVAKHIYKSGVDKALLYFSVSTLIIGLVIIISKHSDHPMLLFLIAFILLSIGSIRYTDALLAGAAYVSLLGFFYQVFASVNFGVMPFSFMLISAGIYFLAFRNLNNDRCRYWRKNLQVVKVLSLLSFYLAGNYFVVREAGEGLMHKYLPKGEDIPLAIVFYLFTAIIPLIYIYWGLKTKNRHLLLTGLGITAIAALTFKNYFSLGHPEILFTAIGTLLIVLSWLFINYLKVPKNGFTFLPDKDFRELEALALVQSFGKADAAAPKQEFEFGGGQFGGGGSGSDF
jgi:hypothetical protein